MGKILGLIKEAMPIVVAIAATGLLLNQANKGTFGATVQGITQQITAGYGQG
jgi:hypothetical protein